MATDLILVILLGMSLSCAAFLAWQWRAEWQAGRDQKGAHAAALRTRDEAHKTALATLNEEFEQMRTRALLAERRARYDEAPVKGAIKMRSASAIRALNDAANEQIEREEEQKHANTALRAG